MTSRNTSTALVVLSGGQDSTTCLVWAKENYDVVHALTFDYQQRHRRELQAALEVAAIVGVTSYEVLSLGPILKGRSPLTNSDETLETYKDFVTMDKIIGNRIELTFVPMRNALFLTLAANRAVCIGTEVDVITGVCEADNANYPDCRASFIESQAVTVRQALGTDGINIRAPLIDTSKAQSIRLMQTMGGYALLAFTHTAYDGSYPPTGNDHASVLRAQGFKEAGLPDPLIVRALHEGYEFEKLPDLYTQTDLMPLTRQIQRLKERLIKARGHSA